MTVDDLYRYFDPDARAVIWIAGLIFELCFTSVASYIIVCNDWGSASPG